jgi:hypothetical protein
VAGALVLALASVVVAGCGGGSGSSASPTTTTSASPSGSTTSATTPVEAKPARRLVSPLRLPRVTSRILPGYLLVADRNNGRVIILSPDKRIVWERTGMHEPDDAFFTPGFRSVITNEEFDETLAEVSLRTKRVIWHYGHAGAAGSAAGYLDAPDDAYRIAGGVTTVADIKNCRIVQVRRNGSVLRVLGGSCAHDPPRAFASPNGDTPLPDGGLLVTEIGGWIDRLNRAGHLVWSVRSPVSYPSDAQLLPNGHILVSGFTTPGRVVEMTRSGRVVWSYGAASGVNRLDRPSLAIRLPNGLVAINDDWRHRVIIIDPRRGRIVWQYGHTDVASSAPGYLDKPDGMDFLPASAAATSTVEPPPRTTSSAAQSPATAVRFARIGTLPAATSKLVAVALPDGRVVAAGGLVGGTTSSQVLVGTPERLRRVGSLPAPTHDAAAVLSGAAVDVYGGGQSTSVPTVFRIDPASGGSHAVHPLDEPLSDLGAAVVRGRTYLVGGFTGSQFATAVLRVERGNRTTVVARLPVGLRYAGVAARGSSIWVAGGVTPAGRSAAIYRIDPVAGRVVRVGTLPAANAHAPLVSAHGALWLIGGDGSRSLLRIDPATGRATIAAPLPRAFVDAAAAVLPDGRVVVLGGNGSDAVWSFRPV